MKWVYYKGYDPNVDTASFWCVYDTMGCELQVNTQGEAHSLCHYLNKNQVNGKFDDIDKVYEDWKNEVGKSKKQKRVGM